MAGSSLVYWEHSLVSKINPFVASATFTTLDSVQRQVEEQAQAVHEIAAVVARLQAGLRELEMTMDQLSQHMSFRSRLLSWVVWAILGLLMVVVFLVVYHVLRG